MGKSSSSLIFKVIWKILLVLVFGGMWISFAFHVVEMQFNESTDYYNSDAFYINQCDEYYFERKYDELFEHMNLYDTYGEEYDIYWEVMDAYINLQEYFKWKEVAEEQIEDARKMEDMYYQKVIEACENCRFSQNKKYLDDFVKSLEP